ncbi:GNAT family N-acetyltransferase [Aliarcobacter cryaerophilus]|uniref:GNAT family N-acetyltransferase n=1 Tax=Aliarcobacter cryaerophilus TaxID=28198 RepID=UPI003DA22BFE
MIKYKLLSAKEDKLSLKTKFLDLFNCVYEKKLEAKLFEHQILNSPYNDSPLFIALDGEFIVGSALMILQKCVIARNKYEYYLFTTSAIRKEYRSKGIYLELLKLQKEYAKKNDVDFIFAFPNKIAYSVLKFFGGFKDLKKFDLVKTTFDNIDFEKIENNLLIDKNFFKWRFEHKDYLFYEFNDKVIIYKEFNDCYDILAIYNVKDFPFPFNNTILEQNKKIIILGSYTKNHNLIEKIDVLNATYFPLNENLDYSKLNVNLLMSDVF